MIDTEALRKKVIDLAIQGKLTEQLPEDGNVEELYQQIQAEKTQLINEKKIKKEKPLPEITAKEIPFEIPKNWKWVRIGDLVKCSLGGGTPSKNVSEYWKNGDIPWASVKDFSAADAGYLNDTIDHITHDGLNNSASNMVDENAIIICMRMALGKVVRFLRPMAINQDLRAIWLHDCVDKSYFMYMYSTFNVEGRGTTVAGIRKDELRSFLFPLPPLSEQKRIVAKIDEVLAEIKIIDELQSQYASNVEVLKSKIIDAGIRGQLTEQLPEDGTAEELLEECRKEKSKIKATGVLNGRKKKNAKSINEDEIPFSIPRTWKWVRLGDVAEIFGRIGFRGYNRKDIVEKGKGAITISPSNIINYGKTVFDKCTYLSWEKYDESPEIMIEEDDVIIVKTGSSYGKCGIVKDLPEKATINPQLAVFKYILCDKCYLNYVLNSSMAKKQYDEFVVGAAIPTFSQEKLGNLCFPLPPLSEQKRIVAKIDSVLAAIGK